jgi:Tol biopolymer transport system component
LKQLFRLLVVGTGLIIILTTVSTALMLPLGQQLPKSDRLAFMATVGDNLDVYIMDMARSLITRFTRSEQWERFPAWSPDGESIAYHSGPPRQVQCSINYDIFVSRLDNRSVRQITGENLAPFLPPLPSFDSFNDIVLEPIRCAAMPDWSPNGEKIAFHANPAGQWDIFVYNFTDDSVRQVTNGTGDEVLFDWGSDSRNGVFATGLEPTMTLSRLDTETGQIEEITSLDDVTTPEGFINTPTGMLEDWHPTLSPDGSQIAFMSNRAGGEDIYVMNADGTDLRNLTSDSYSDSNPIWTADGQIIFTSDRLGVTRLYTLDPQNGDVEMLIGWNFPHNMDGAAYWSPSFYASAPVS